jgi:hypothetical protein
VLSFNYIHCWKISFSVLIFLFTVFLSSGKIILLLLTDLSHIEIALYIALMPQPVEALPNQSSTYPSQTVWLVVLMLVYRWTSCVGCVGNQPQGSTSGPSRVRGARWVGASKRQKYLRALAWHLAEVPCYKPEGRGSIPDAVIGFFNPSSRTTGPRVDSVSNRNEYQESSWG